MTRHEEALKKLAEGTVIPALPLALNKDRKLDERRQRALLRYYLASGSGGIAVAVHSTQFEIRNKDVNLFQPVLRIAEEEISRFETKTGNVIVRICGVCGDTEQAIEEAEFAKKTGYDAVLLSPGGLEHRTEEELLERTRAVAKILPVIGFYLQTAVGGRKFSYDYWKYFCQIENVVAIKSAPFNRYQTLDLVRAAATSKRRNEISLYTGNDDNIVIDLLTNYKFQENGQIYEKHFVGGLLGHWAIWTRNVVDMYEKLKNARKEGMIPSEYLTLAAQITDVNGVVFDVANEFRGCIPGIHEVLRRQGLLEGIWCLDENELLSEGQIEELDRVYAMYPHLNDDAFIKEHLNEWLYEEKGGIVHETTEEAS